ncbi:PGA52-like protein [Fulvia fulva]|uniref:glucan endo-1,3-beta-D-glucosidase n=1 Tax=Passalora fulva TaxID=5499 RepID=A0A1P8YXU4_PASFU|nr:PGA52-like protein [Fulvia fulva]AQA29341.1 hypothetical protein 48 [Fulvia fulva]KAK4628834.1 PGA52-like protein [Fulvia fulva]KAK4630552.1 PGA52-like protein [Fulvia fulva]UJO15307.1 PGA52-like protein [Fulvia fulva]WPV13053.1 PGA52-like protein [Fulvia fulva]
MKYLYTAATLLAATVSADLCAHGSTDVDGNWYCQEVKAITYTGVGGEGSYNKVTSMANGACGSTPHAYNGTLSPFDEEVSLHFRGPLELKQFAFYAPAAAAPSYSKEKRTVGRRSAIERRHGHAHGHAHAHLHHARDEEKRTPALGEMVTAVINGVTQTWKNTYDGGAAAPKEGSPAASPPSYGGASAGSAAAPHSYGGASSSSTSKKPTTSSSGNDDDDSSSSGGTGWTRQGYYNAEAGTSDGIVFLNHEGGSGSGVFDYSFGNSLSYSSADGKSGASAPTTLANCQLASDTEVVIMTDDKCNAEDGSCGFYRDGTVAYHGFDGPSKAFFFEFSMPDDGTTAANKYDPTNMPAIWLLNAQIPRTLQYGNAECSCWTTGCGEFDIFEVLAPGDKRCKSTLHGNIAGGDSDYFARPTSGTIKAALLLYKDNIHIKILDDSTDFGKTMGDSFINEICQDTLADSLEGLVSLFKLGS